MSSKSSDEYSIPKSNVNETLRKISQALGFSTFNDCTIPLLTYDAGKVRLKEEVIEQGLKDHNIQRQELVVRSLQEKLNDIPSSAMLHIWDLISQHVNLSNPSKLRSECFTVLEFFLKKQEDLKETDIEMVYASLKDNFKQSFVDPDLAYFVGSLHEITKSADSKLLRKLDNLETFLNTIFEQAIEAQSDQIILLSVVSISECIQLNTEFLSEANLNKILNKLIFLNQTETVTRERLLAFIEFFSTCIMLNFSYDDKKCQILLIIGHGLMVEDVTIQEHFKKVFQEMIANDVDGIVYTICDIIDGKHKHGDLHLKKERQDIVGCIRMLMFLAREINCDSPLHKQKEIKKFFNKGALYLIRCFLDAAKVNDRIISREIMKFFVQFFENPYVITTSYKVIVEHTSFWELLQELNVGDHRCNTGFSTVQTELFNKLQNLKLDVLFKQKLVDYFELNADYLSSYNINYVLDYYWVQKMCVCGTPNWKNNCEKIIKDYYAISPSKVIDILKDAFFYCRSLKIDEELINFYISCICYLCVLNLPIELGDEILDPLVDVILLLNFPKFKEIISNYEAAVRDLKDININFMVKTITLCSLKSIDRSLSDKKKLLLKTILNIASVTWDSKYQYTFLFPILTLLNVRVMMKNSKRLYFIEDISIANQKLMKLSSNSNIKSNEYRKIDMFIEETIFGKFDDSSFDLHTAKYFVDGKTATFEDDIDLHHLLQLYSDILSSTTRFENYILVMLCLRDQLLNMALFDKRCQDSLSQLVELLCSQMQDIFVFKFTAPYWVQNEQLKVIIVSVLYGFIPHKRVICEDTLEALIRTIILNYHFTNFTRDSYVNFINCCLYEIPKIMKHFICAILKLIVDDVNKLETHMMGLEFIHSVMGMENYYDLNEREMNLVRCFLNSVYHSKYVNEDQKFKVACQDLCSMMAKKHKITNLTFEPFFMKNNLAVEFKYNLSKDDGGNLKRRFEKLEEEIVSYYSKSSVEGSKVLVIFEDFESSMPIDDGKQIIIRKISQDFLFYNVITAGFKFINIRNTVIEDCNIKLYARNLIEISSAC